MWTALAIAAIGIAVCGGGLWAFGRAERKRGKAEIGREITEKAEEERHDAMGDLRTTGRRMRAVWRRVRDGQGS